MSWKSALRAALILNIAVCVLVHAYVQAVIPPLIVLFVLFNVALYLLRRDRRAGVWIGGIASLLLLLGNLQLVLEDLGHPDSPLAFVSSGAGVVGAIGGFIAMVAVLRRWPPAGAAPMTYIGGAIVAVLMVVGIVGGLGVDSDERQEGDIAIEAEDVEWSDEELTVESGGAVFVDNKDGYRHTFTVEDLDIDQELPANANKRVVIDGEPGTYDFVCEVTGHDDMEGRLTVR
jgi:plastocyanin